MRSWKDGVYKGVSILDDDGHGATDIAIRATVTKRGDSLTVDLSASDPQVTFSSTPELPQDEILARLIFQKGMGELSPLQIARLAAAVSELSGGSGGLLSRLRASTGLDDLDIVTDEKGQTSVAAGRYITENVYLGVQQGMSIQARDGASCAELGAMARAAMASWPVLTQRHGKEA